MIAAPVQSDVDGIPKRSHSVFLKPTNENKMSGGGQDRASLGVKGWKSSQKWSVQRSAVRSIAWLGDIGFTRFAAIQRVDKC
jgi:hypothetical protein